MRCERIQELILTDYMDGSLDENIKREADEHMRICARCGEFKRLAIDKASSPFRLAQAAQAPSYIWERVKKDIAAETTKPSGIIVRAADMIRDAFWSIGRVPRPAIVFAAAAVMVIAVFIARPIARTYAVNDYLTEHIEFMINLDSAEPNGNGFFSTEIKTGIDHLV